MQFDMHNFTLAAPLLALAAGTMVVLLFDLIMDAKKAQPLWYLFSLASVALAGYYLVPLWDGGVQQGFGGAMVIDPFALVFSAILLGVTFLAVLLAFPRTEEDKSGYLALLLWAAMGLLTLASAGSLMTIFLGLELLSLSLYVMVAFDKRQEAREAALKYFVLGSVASAFILFGFALVYGVTGSMLLSEIAAAGATGGLYYKVGIGLAVVGFAFKLALVPFHAWAPDVYEGAPTAVTAFMSVGTKAAAFAAAARFLMAVVPEEQQAKYLLPLSLLAAASMLLGSTVGIWQRDIKRLMAYSGIAHAGYLILAVPGLGAEGLTAAAYYLAAYGFTALGIFAVVELLEAEGEEGSKLETLRGLYYRRPGLAAAMALFMFALAGLPPTGGFIGKFLLAKAAVTANAWILLTALILSTGISAYVYLRVIGTMFKQTEAQAKAESATMAGAEAPELALSPEAVRYGLLAVLVISVAGTLWLGVLPGSALKLLTVSIGL